MFYEILNHFEASYTKRILVEAVQLMGQLWPYLVFGIIATTLITIFISKQQMVSFFNRRNFATSIIIASLIGIISPFGSYVIIPMAAALLLTGVPLHVLMALMVASPLINPNLFLLTTGAMGLEMAIMRVLSAFVLGIFAGYLTLWIEKRYNLSPEIIINKNKQPASIQYFNTENKRSIPGFFNELFKITSWVSRFFFLAIILAAAIKILVNPVIIVRLFDSDSFLSVALLTGAGIPFYICGGAAIPVVQQLADLGLSKGAVLAFFISGPVTKISTLVIISQAFERTVLMLYLAIGIGGAFIIGLFYNLF
jgi:uncharacterized membrane protein YraQ (UPF0718 family)